jgi:hypothetical protein
VGSAAATRAVWCSALGVLAAVPTVALPAQQPESSAHRFARLREQIAAGALAQLRSADPATIAWGAHTAAEFRLEGCVPELKSQLTAVSGGERPFVAA